MPPCQSRQSAKGYFSHLGEKRSQACNSPSYVELLHLCLSRTSQKSFHQTLWPLG
jgi:hypothetical protein